MVQFFDGVGERRNNVGHLGIELPRWLLCGMFNRQTLATKKELSSDHDYVVARGFDFLDHENVIDVVEELLPCLPACSCFSPRASPDLLARLLTVQERSGRHLSGTLGSNTVYLDDMTLVSCSIVTLFCFASTPYHL